MRSTVDAALSPACKALAAGLLALSLGAASSANPTSNVASPLRVGTSGDYEPFSTRVNRDGEEVFNGFGPALIRAYANDRGRDIEFVPFTWPRLRSQLEAGDFDVAVGGITVRADRALLGEFTVPIALSGAVVLVPDGIAADLDALDTPDRRVAVNRGGHLERVTRARFPKAKILTFADNAAVPRAMLSGDADVAVTDTREAPVWTKLADGIQVLPPFTQDRKAFLVGKAPGLATDLNHWLLEKEADGTLGQIRAAYLGDPPDGAPTATPLLALLAAMDLRLELMPAVAEAKRRSGSPIEVPEREAAVLDAAVSAVEEALSNADGARALSPAAEGAVRQLYRAQIEAAKSIQRATLAGAPAPGGPPSPDLITELRPALLRIGEQIAGLILQLPAGLDQADVLAATTQELAGQPLSDSEVDAIARAIAAVADSL